MTRVCVFHPQSGATVDDWPETALLPRVTRDGAQYRRHRLSLLSNAKSIQEALVYAPAPLSPGDEFLVFAALFPNRGGVFQIEPLDD